MKSRGKERMLALLLTVVMAGSLCTGIEAGAQEPEQGEEVLTEEVTERDERFPEQEEEVEGAEESAESYVSSEQTLERHESSPKTREEVEETKTAKEEHTQQERTEVKEIQKRDTFESVPDARENTGGYWKDSEGVTWYYTTDPDTHEIAVTGCRDGKIDELRIPSYINGNKVTRVGESGGWNSGFSYSGAVSGTGPLRVVFPDTVNYIERQAFSSYEEPEEWGDEPPYYAYIKEIVLPQNPELQIGDYAFENCINLETVRFNTVGSTQPQPVSFGSEVFSGCLKLKELTLPLKSTCKIDTFEGCTSLVRLYNAPGIELSIGPDVGDSMLEEIVYAEGVTEVEGLSWRSYPKLKTVTLPSTCKSVDGFSECRALSTVNFPQGLESIGFGAFERCTALTGIDSLPESVTYIGNYAFAGCKNLHLRVKFPESSEPYYSCDHQFQDSGIVSIILPASMNIVYFGAFTGCKNLESIQVASGNKVFYARDGVLYDKLSSGEPGGLFIYPAGKSKAGSYTIPSDVTAIAPYAFDSCKFTEIHIPPRVSSFSDYGMDAYPFDKMQNTCYLYVVHNSWADIELTPQYKGRIRYEKDTPVAIRYKLNGGKNHSGNVSKVIAGQSITLKAPEREGYKFLGWVNKENSGENYLTSYEPKGGEIVDGVTFEACWEKIKKVTKISISGLSHKIAAGKKVTLKATVSPSNATNKAVTWKSGNTRYATVSSKGVVTMKKAGKGKTVTITATAKDGSKKKATYKIKFMKGAVKKVSISGKSRRTVQAGKTVTLKASVKTTVKSSKDVNKTLKWTTSNKKYATVTSKGKVRTLKAGKGKKVKITAAATDGSGKKATVTITLR